MLSLNDSEPWNGRTHTTRRRKRRPRCCCVLACMAATAAPVVGGSATEQYALPLVHDLRVGTARDSSTTTVASNISGNIRCDALELVITDPPPGSLSAADHMSLRFDTRPHDLRPKVAWIDITSGDQVFRLDPQATSVGIHAVEPGTHVVQVTALMSAVEGDGRDRESGGSTSAEVMWDAVLSPEGIRRHRMMIAEGVKPAALSVGARVIRGSEIAEGDDGIISSSDHSSERIKLCFVSSLKLDGQRTIFLQQMQRLPRPTYHISILHFAQGLTPSSDGQQAHVFSRRAEELGVPIVAAEAPSVSLDVLEAVLGPDKKNDVEAIIRYALDRLDANGRRLESLSPPFVHSIFACLVDAIRRINPDVLVFANGREINDRLLVESARMAGVPVIVMELPNLYPHVPLDVDAVVAPSHYAALHPSVQALATSGGAAGNGGSGAAAAGAGRNYGTTAPESHLPCYVLTPGVDEKRFRPGTRADRRALPGCDEQGRDAVTGQACVVIGFLGRLDTEKSPGLFLKMAALVRSSYSGARFVVVGYGGIKGALEREARRLGLGPDVMTFMGTVHEGLPDVLRGMDVLVNPSLRAWSETYCIANVEGMASGLPVVGFGVGGTGEYLRHMYNSVIVDEAAPESLADAVLKLCEDPQLRARLGENARETVVRNHTVARQMQEYDTLYRSLLRRKLSFVNAPSGTCESA